jgi:hypothetical protein
MDAPNLRYRRQPLMRKRIDVDAPLVGARLYKGARPVVLARMERTRALEPQRTIPVTLSELRHQVDLERGYWDDRRDIPSALIGYPMQRRASPDTPQAVLQDGVEPLQHKLTSTLQISPETHPLRVGPDAYPTYPDQYAMQRRVMRGLGVTAVEQPVYRPRKMTTPSLLAPVTFLRGLGDAGDTTGWKSAEGATIALVLGLIVGGGYFAGAAMAPAGRDKVSYGVLGSVLGLFGGPIGLGVLGLVALSSRR